MESRSTNLEDAKHLEKEIIKICKSKKGKFVDKDFPANSNSIGKNMSGVTWKRPTDFLKNPSLFVNGIESGDVIQGELGDCWFLGSMSVVATRNDLLYPLFISSHPEYGFYQIKFYKDGDWRVVTIDDFLPCRNERYFVFSHCKDEDEFWVPLMEKAFAKLNGSYINCESGHLGEGMTDLTGEGAQVFNFKDEEVKTKIRNGEFWRLLKYFESEKFLLGCSLSGGMEKDNGRGILSGHAYAVLKVVEYKDHKLIKIRNPWGKHEWKGPWSDGSKEWSQDSLKKLNHKFGDDGTFWMCFEDFVTNYNNLSVCRLLTDKYGDLWHRKDFVGKWDSHTAGGCCNNNSWIKNDQFWVQVIHSGTKVYCHLAQGDGRCKGKPNYTISIGLYVWELKDPKQKLKDRSAKTISNPTFINSRESCCSVELPEGFYCVMPCTFNPGDATNFYLSIYSNKTIKCGVIEPSHSARSRNKGGSNGKLEKPPSHLNTNKHESTSPSKPKPHDPHKTTTTHKTPSHSSHSSSHTPRSHSPRSKTTTQSSHTPSHHGTSSHSSHSSSHTPRSHSPRSHTSQSSRTHNDKPHNSGGTTVVTKTTTTKSSGNGNHPKTVVTTTTTTTKNNGHDLPKTTTATKTQHSNDIRHEKPQPHKTHDHHSNEIRHDKSQPHHHHKHHDNSPSHHSSTSHSSHSSSSSHGPQTTNIHSSQEYKSSVKASWSGKTAGGSPGIIETAFRMSVSENQAWKDNIFFEVRPEGNMIPNEFKVIVTLQQPKDRKKKAGIFIFSKFKGGNEKFSKKYLDCKSSIQKKELILFEFTFKALHTPYLIMAATEKPGKENNYLLSIQSSEKLALKQINLF